MNSSLLNIIGRSGLALLTHQKALDVTTHNISNVNTPEYSRQVVELSQTKRELGISVEITHIERVRDIFLDIRINEETEKLSYWKAINDKLHRIELIYNEPGETNIRTLLDEFWASLEDLANNPENAAPREIVKQRGIVLAESIRHTYTRISNLQEVANQEIKERVEEINIYASRIATLSKKIQSHIDKGTSPPNDLLDKRDSYIEKLSKLGDLRIERLDPDDFKISVNGLVVAQGDRFYPIVARPDPKNQNFVEIYSKVTGERAKIRGGELGGLFLVRDEIIPFHLNRLDELAITLIDRFNEIHRAGFGLDNTKNINFFKPFLERDEDAIYKVTGSATGYVDNVEISFNALPYLNPPPFIDPVTAGKLEINGKLIPYDPDREDMDSLEDVVRLINEAKCGVIASISPSKRLVLTATSESNYKISSLSDYVETDFRKSRFEVIPGPGKINLEASFYPTNFTNPVTGSISINGATFNIWEYRTVQELMDAINSSKEAGVTISYDEEEDMFTIRSDTPGDVLILSEREAVSTSPVSTRGPGVGLNIDTAFTRAGFLERIGGDHTIIINGVPFHIDVDGRTGYTVREFINEVNYSNCGAVIIYDIYTDRFSIISRDKNRPVELRQSIPNGFLGVANICDNNDTSTHMHYGFLTEIKILEGRTSGNLFEKLGILQKGKKYIAFSHEHTPEKALKGEYVKVPREGAASLISLTEDILQDINKIAAAKGKDISYPLDGEWDISNGVGDGENALDLAGLNYKRFLLSGEATFNEFTHFLISKIGEDTRRAEKATESQGLILRNLEGLRDSISGVSLDEEFVNLIRYQHGFNASARVIGVITGLLDRVIALGA